MNMNFINKGNFQVYYVDEEGNYFECSLLESENQSNMPKVERKKIEDRVWLQHRLFTYNRQYDRPALLITWHQVEHLIQCLEHAPLREAIESGNLEFYFQYGFVSRETYEQYKDELKQ